jgi:hypothetical protein
MNTERVSNLVRGSARVLAAVVFVFAFVSYGSAQSNSQIQKPVSIEIDRPSKDDPMGAISSIEEEMRAKRAIRTAEKEYQNNLDRARDLSVLGASIVASYKQKNGLDREDVRNLERVEKLAKGIRSAAGGCEDDVDLEKPPRDLTTAMNMLGELSKSLKEKVEKTPKHVISAAVIDEANVLLELIRIVRTLPPKV